MERKKIYFGTSFIMFCSLYCILWASYWDIWLKNRSRFFVKCACFISSKVDNLHQNWRWRCTGCVTSNGGDICMSSIWILSMISHFSFWLFLKNTQKSKNINIYFRSSINWHLTRCVAWQIFFKLQLTSLNFYNKILKAELRLFPKCFYVQFMNVCNWSQ